MISRISWAIKALVAYIAIFTYLYPVALKILPVDTGVILHLFGFIYFVLYRSFRLDHTFLYVFAFTILLVLCDVFTTTLNNSYDFSVLKKNIASILYVFSAIMVVDLIKATCRRSSYSVYTILDWIIYAAIGQAIISFLLFFSPDLMDIYKSLATLNEASESILEITAEYRLIAVSKTQYANMAVMYGFALLFSICAIRFHKSNTYKKKVIYYISIILICFAGILSARTFFLILLLSYCYLIYLHYKRSGLKSVIYMNVALAGIVSLIILCTIPLSDSEYANTFNWAFEWYNNLSETGELRTASSDTLSTMYIFPNSIKTWLFGDGKFSLPNGSFYMHTDVGYLRNLFYGGILGTLLCYLIQYLYRRQICSICPYPAVRHLCNIIFIWVIIYNFKEYWVANLYWILLLAAVVKEKKLIMSHS